MQLRPYQQECVEALAEARKAGEKRGIVSMACGLGKTVTAITDVEQFLAEFCFCATIAIYYCRRETGSSNISEMPIRMVYL